MKEHLKSIEIFTSIDLEMNQPSRKIIQIGAIVGNIATGEILERFSVFVNPKEKLSEKIIKLTKITQKDVDNGFTLEEAYNQLRALHEKHNSFINPLTWGGGDSQELLNQLRKPLIYKILVLLGLKHNIELGWCFGRRWVDVKTLFVSWRFLNGKPIQGGLAKSMLKVGLKFQGQKHNATDDAENTFHIYRKMLSLFKSDV